MRRCSPSMVHHWRRPLSVSVLHRLRRPAGRRPLDYRRTNSRHHPHSPKRRFGSPQHLRPRRLLSDRHREPAYPDPRLFQQRALQFLGSCRRRRPLRQHVLRQHHFLRSHSDRIRTQHRRRYRQHQFRRNPPDGHPGAFNPAPARRRARSPCPETPTSRLNP